TVEIVTSWESWKRPGRILASERDDGWRATSYDLPPGENAYGIVEDGVWISDPNVPTSAFHEGHEVAWLSTPDCNQPAVRVDSATGSADGHASVAASFLAARAGNALDPASIVATEKKGGAVIAPDHVDADPGKGTIALSFSALAAGKHTIVVTAKDTEGHAAAESLATVWIEQTPFDVRDSVIYQVMVDRYRNENGALAPPSLPSLRAGGNLRGVRAAIESGELAKMGVNTLWLSPLYKNPDGTFPGNDGRPYSSYHGYWPIDSRALEPAVASEEDLDALVAAAHTRGLRVIFDVVPNHVHEQHAYAKDHAGDGWFNDPGGKCVCGTATCDWASHIIDCWFAPYLPDLDWTNPAVAKQITSDVVFWLDRFDGDGLRIDAVPMMPRAASRRIAAAVRAEYDYPGHKTLLLGENFTGPGGYGLLRYELGPFGLDSEFHFPLMWSLRATIAEMRVPMTDIDATVHAGEETWNGSGAVMGLIIGNHDVSRFASVSAGDADGDGWVGAAQSIDPRVYAKQQMALGLVFTLPGAPVVYYGDEVGLAGRADPDSRRVMPAEAELSALQLATRANVIALGKARACST
ncbi:MAG: alpha-amylase family glycosyl hydrolase, partial [Polyangiaceae bacterium]